MKRKKTIKINSILALILSVLSISIAFAAMSKTVKITINNIEDINVHFENLSNGETKGNARIISKPKMEHNKALIKNMVIKLAFPNDEVRYTVDIVNENNYDTQINYIINPNISDIDKEIFEFSSYYTNTKKTIKIGDVLKAKEKVNVTLIFKYKNITNKNLIPKKPKKINVSYYITYVKKENYKNNSSTEQKDIDEFLGLYNKILLATKKCSQDKEDYCSYKSIEIPEELNLIHCKNNNYYYIRLSVNPIGRKKINLFNKYNEEEITKILSIDENCRKTKIDSNSISTYYYEGSDYDPDYSFSCSPF